MCDDYKLLMYKQTSWFGKAWEVWNVTFAPLIEKVSMLKVRKSRQRERQCLEVNLETLIPLLDLGVGEWSLFCQLYFK